ncbi:MAG TPA: YIP1 family protein [Pyrinomonadaceae bacterium]|nr:YIP1 family protein [Pyrinomonadaceae bacterium]
MSAPTEPAFAAPPPPPAPHVEPKAPRPTYLWPFAIGSFVIGLAILVGTIAGLIPRGWATAVSFCFLGILLFGLSFIRLPSVPPKEEPLSLLQKVTGIFFEPSRVFRNLREHPRWIGAFLIIAVLSAAYSFAFIQRITPERIADHSKQQMEAFGNLVPPEAREAQAAEQLDAMKNPVRRAASILNVFTVLFVLLTIVAVLSLLGVLVFGGRINFWQSLAVTFYVALPVTIITKVLGLIILYLKEPEDLHPVLNRDTTLQDNLSILFSAADHPVLFVMASFIGLTSFYGLWLRAKGLHLGATKASSGAGWGVSIGLWLLGFFLLSMVAFLAPSFFS